VGASAAILRQREFRLLFGGQAVSLLGDGMVRVALPFGVLSVDSSASAVGLVLAARMLAFVGCLLAGGVVADRLSRRAIMVAADVVRLAAQGVTAGLLIAGVAEVWSLALLAAAAGAASGFFNPASTGLLPAVVRPEELQAANGLRATAMAGGEIVGPAVAGALVVFVGAGWALAVDAATFGVSALLLSRLRLPAHVARESTSFLADLRDGWREFRSRRWVWTFVASIAVSGAMWGAWSALGPVVADRELGGAGAWAAILAAMGAGGLLGGLVSIRIEPSRPLVVAALAGLPFSLPLGLLAAGADVPVLALGGLVSGVAMMVGNSVWESALQRQVPAESLSRVSAYDWFGSSAFMPIGLAVWGPVGVAVGLGSALWIAFAVQVAAVLALLAVPEIRAMRGDLQPSSR
jgi:predicted MFS family arabinose efflux permease